MPPLRVLTYNIYFGGRDRVGAIGDVLAQAQPDIISLTEADDHEVVAALADRLEMHFIWAAGSGERHIATLSRYPISEWLIYNQPPLTQAVLKTIHYINGSDVAIFNLHLLPYLLLPFEVRRWQAVGKLLGLTAPYRSLPHLIMGDLNAVGRGDRVLQQNNPARMRRTMLLQFGLVFSLAHPRLLAGGYVDCYRALHPTDDGFTWMPQNRTTRYDYIFAPGFMRAMLRCCRVFDDAPQVNVASDHLPLLAEFEL